MFFNDHPEFLETSRTATEKGRLNLRHLAIIVENADILKGRTVVDIASHDGRWAYAALDAGAAHVIGIEGRQELIDHANRTFQAKGVPEEQYTFVQGDVHEALLRPEVKGDVVLCLGFLYHTARYVELMAGIRSTGAKFVIADTRVITGVEGPLVEMRTEGTVKQSVAIKDRFARGTRVLSAIPSEAALEVMFAAAGYRIDHRTDWSEILAQHPRARGIAQYANGTRITVRAKRRRGPKKRAAGRAAGAEAAELTGSDLPSTQRAEPLP